LPFKIFELPFLKSPLDGTEKYNLCQKWLFRNIGCSFKFILKLDVEDDCEPTTDYRSRISCLNLTSLFALFVFLVCRLTSVAFTINSSTPTLRINLNEHPMQIDLCHCITTNHRLISKVDIHSTGINTCLLLLTINDDRCYEFIFISC
jgi:hypothetical protein